MLRNNKKILLEHKLMTFKFDVLLLKENNANGL